MSTNKYQKNFIKNFLAKKKEEKAIKQAEKLNKEMKEKREEARRQFMLRLLSNAKTMNEAREDIENSIDEENKNNG